MSKKINTLAKQLGKALKRKSWMISTAESCTGGGVAQAITEIPGSSAWFDRGFVTYSNIAKMNMLQVKQQTLDKFGAVSEEVVIEMANGALKNSDADWVVSVTGVAGPDGGTEQKPVGTVYIGWQFKGQSAEFSLQLFSGDRTKIREQTIVTAITMVLQRC